MRLINIQLINWFRVPVLAAGLLMSSCDMHSSSSLVVPSSPKLEDYQRVPFIAARSQSESDGSFAYESRQGTLSAGECYAHADMPRVEPIYIVRNEIETVIRNTEASAEESNIVLYMHGYNESFENSCARATSIQAKLNLAGRLLLFSWPTKNNSWSYRGDLENLSNVQDSLMQVLTQLQDAVGAENITLIGHSLGAKGMVEALKRIPLPDNSQNRIDKLILLAPDIARDDFLLVSDALQQRVNSIVVFVSSRDRALKLSQSVHRKPRLGQARFQSTGNIRIVDVSKAGGFGLSGHLYHVRSPMVIRYLRNLLAGAGEPITTEDRSSHWRLQLQN